MLCGLILVGCSTQNKPKEKEAETSEVTVFSLASADDKKEFSTLKLDDTHLNMLNPKIAKEKHEEAMQSWTDIHVELNQFLHKEEFDWGTDAERIKIFNKIYFQKDGRVKYYVYGVYADVSPEKVTAFGKLAKEFFANQKISLTRDVDFAQCGKASLLNSKI
jgi:hypothetical protein